MQPAQRAADALARTVRAHRDRDEDLCVTFSRPEGWLQVTWNNFNMSYPLQGSPAEALALPASMALLAWEPGKFATFTHDGGMDAVAFLTGYAERILGAPLDERWEQEDEVL